MNVKRSLYNFTGFTWFDIKRNRNNKSHFNWSYSLITLLLWFALLPLLIFQFIGVFVFVNWLFRSGNMRKMTCFEENEARLVFSKSINYNKVRIKESSKWAQFGTRFVKSPHLGFVFLNTVHFSKTIESKTSEFDMAWLVHEMTHISQYQKCGIIYIFKSLRAQRNGGYSYQKKWFLRPLKHCNFEQQAEISKYYYIDLKKNKDVTTYNSIIEEVRKSLFC